ncbi:MAG: alpha/beta fold hydrolase, partial [Rhizobiales bacterium]|nr:alpha/beta fold hydrolase [Hyphomicrobiales bacterium]
MTKACVFLHGVGGAGRIWRPQVEHFSGEYEVLAWDAPGYGGRAPLANVSFEALAAQLDEDMDKAGLKSASIIGHSFGGMVAQQLVKDFPHRVQHLVLSGTSPAFGKPEGDFQQKFVAARTKPLDEGKTMAEVAAKVAPNLVAKDAPASAIELAIDCMSQVPEATYRSVISLLTTFDLRANLGEIKCPTLLIAGSEDTTAPAAMMERMAARIPTARFTTMPGAGHLAPIEQPAQFNQIVEAFIS